MQNMRHYFSSQEGRRAITGYVFISPFLLGLTLFVILPAATAAWLAFNDWNMITPPKFVGFENFARLGRDKLFWQALKVTTIYTFISVPLMLIISFLAALLMNVKVRGISFFRTIYYMPVIVPAVASAVLWAWILNTEYGLLNIALRAIGLPKIQWLQQPEWALPALILMSLWSFGATMVIYLAGLQGIPDTFYEAADIDGAGRWKKLRHITLPLMSSVIFFNLIIGLIGSFQVFTAGFLITNGGPQNATLFYVLYLYRVGFRQLDMGYASALAWVLFFIILTLTALTFKYVGGQVYYEEGS